MSALTGLAIESKEDGMCFDDNWKSFKPENSKYTFGQMDNYYLMRQYRIMWE